MRWCEPSSTRSRCAAGSQITRYTQARSRSRFRLGPSAFLVTLARARLCSPGATTRTIGGQAAARALPALRRRDVGALLVLRDARACWCSSSPTAQRGGLGWSKAAADRLYGCTASAPTRCRCWAATWPIGSSARTARWSLAGSSSPPATSAWRCRRRADVLPRPGADRDRHRLLQAQRVDDGRPALPRRTIRGATAASPSSTWASTSAPSSGPIVCGYLAESPRWGWHYGFGAAGVGMVLGLALYLAFKARYLPGIGLPPARVPPARRRRRRRRRARRLTPHRARLSDRAVRDHGVLDPVLDGLRAGRLVDELLRGRAHATDWSSVTRSPRPGSSR